MEFRHKQYLECAEDTFVVINNKDVVFLVLHKFGYQNIYTFIVHPQFPTSDLPLPKSLPRWEGLLAFRILKAPLGRFGGKFLQQRK
jgi:hypothetical protein